MKRILLSLSIFTILLSPVQKAHALDAKSKAFMVMCSYGTVGGALLGFASMAFGTNSKAIAQGASLGLYAGIIFGAYVVTSYNSQQLDGEDQAYGGQAPMDPYGQPGGYQSPAGYQNPGGYQQNGYPPQQAPQGGGGGGYGAPVPQDNGGFFGAPRRVIEIQEKFSRNFKPLSEKRETSPPVFVNLINASF